MSKTHKKLIQPIPPVTNGLDLDSKAAIDSRPKNDELIHPLNPSVSRFGNKKRKISIVPLVSRKTKFI